eukprot:jgi/Mesen1/5763/ME000292S04844
MLARLFGRSLVTAPPVVRRVRGLEEFFDVGKKQDEPFKTGRSWEAWELRQKSYDDLHKLWYVLLKEKNLLYSQKGMLRTANIQFPNSNRVAKVKKSMCRIKQVLTERALTEQDEGKQLAYKRMINDM